MSDRATTRRKLTFSAGSTTRNDSKCPTSAAAPELECPKVGLSARKQAAIEMILIGSTDTDVARALMASRRTIYRWRTKDAAFRDLLDCRRREVYDRATDRMRSLLENALNTLGRQVVDTYAPTSHRAARTLLSLARVGKALEVDSSAKSA